MDDSAPDESRDRAIEQLQQFGLSTYAARTFVALAELGTGTAKDVSRVADVPRTRVYDAVEELRERRLVDIQHSTPKRFTPVSAETTVRKFDEERRRRTDVLATALDHLEPVSPRKEQQGVWTVEGQTAVADRVLEFFAAADSEIVYMTVEDLLTEELVDGLGDAADRGVSIKLAGLSPEVQERIREEIPGADLFESLWVWSDTPAGRLLMVDGTQTLVSVLTNGRQRSPPGPRSETAIWGAGETNSLVVVLRAIFTWRLGADDDGVSPE
jgi:sugar-specific transcriptional regulator TrmB